MPVPIRTPEHLRHQLEELDVTNHEAAYFAGVADATVYRWLNGESPIPASVTRMFDLLLHVQKGAEMVKVVWGTPEPEEAENVLQQIWVPNG